MRARGGQTRGDNRASDHDFGTGEKYIPCGIVDEDSGQYHLVKYQQQIELEEYNSNPSNFSKFLNSTSSISV